MGTDAVEMAEAQGDLHVGENLAPVTYRVDMITGEAGKCHVTVSLKAPRDWLLQMGFSSEAQLRRTVGDVITVGTLHAVDVGDNVSITLQSEALAFDDRNAVVESFPEFSR